MCNSHGNLRNSPGTELNIHQVLMQVHPWTACVTRTCDKHTLQSCHLRNKSEKLLADNWAVNELSGHETKYQKDWK